MIRSEAYVKWYRQACDAQDPDRPNMEADIEAALDEGDTRDGDDEHRFNKVHGKGGKFAAGIGGPSAASVAKTRITQAKAAEPGLTKTAGGLAAKHGGRQEGLANRVKTQASLTRKIKGDVADSDGVLTPTTAGAKLFDVNRYTTVFEPGAYAKGAQGTIDDLRADGSTLNVKNFWDNPDNPYQGINVQVTSPAGEKWELQFHTENSLSGKNELHEVYELQRIETDMAVWNGYREQMFGISETIPVPDGVAGVG